MDILPHSRLQWRFRDKGLWSVEGLLGLYLENAIAIDSEAGDSLNVSSGQTGI